MSKSGDFPGAYFSMVVSGLNAQAIYQKLLSQSAEMLRYIAAIEKNMSVMREVVSRGDFEVMLAVEQALQKVEIERFSHDADMMESIRKTQVDLAEGIKDYRQLTENPEAYCARGYREKDCTGPRKKFPLDTMRKTLRGQAARVGNFAKNPMLFPIEKEFHLLRVSLLKRAEKLYEALQARAIATQEDR